MSGKVQQILKNIINPNNGKTLFEEGRVLEMEERDGTLYFKYKRDGITPENKREIENKIIMALEGLYSEDKITIQTVSSDSQDVYKAPPASHSQPKQAQAQIKAGHGPAASTKKRVANVKKLIAVSSCKGGVGKSTVAVNLAYSLKNLGKKVGLLDADIYGPSLPMLLNKRDAKPTANDNKKILPVDANGIPFISFGLFINENDPVIWRGPMLGGVLNQFLFDVDWGDLDYLIIDLPPGTGDMQLSMVQATDVDGAVIVSTPQEVALLDTKKGLQMFNQVKVPVVGMIENMSFFVPDDMPEKKYYIFGQGGVKKASEQLSVNFLGEIPLEMALREGSDAGQPYMNEKKYEGRAVWKAYMELAKKIDEQLLPSSDNKGFFKKLFS